MAQRVVEMHRILKDTGSLYLHCDPTAGHYLKLLLDSVFGKNSFRNEIVWCYRGGGSPKNGCSH
jgi:site-specific DNA-methyltransferase (adenine-specific)